VFNMATQFGGGKFHALTALYHLAKHGEAAKSWKGVDSILQRAEVTTVPKADVAVFFGTEFDALQGRSGDGEPTRRTRWGEIAWQLGGAGGLFANTAEYDERKVAPAGYVLRKMLANGPTLILMDELLNHVSAARKVEMRDQFFSFLQNLCEEARARNYMAQCTSVPMSELEMSPEDERDCNSIKKLCDRTGKTIMMSADEEIAEIIRRRFFEWHGLPAGRQENGSGLRRLGHGACPGNQRRRAGAAAARSRNS
jgi:predicted AAA+ superfamily ATPase